jgi:hypothetical protein
MGDKHKRWDWHRPRTTPSSIQSPCPVPVFLEATHSDDPAGALMRRRTNVSPERGPCPCVSPHSGGGRFVGGS